MHFVLILDQLKSRPLEPEGGAGDASAPVAPPSLRICMFTNFHF